jgi:BCD family chlorophyll transporter-like MFS transporter
MFFMMITSIIFTAIGLSRMVDPYTPQALVRAFWTVGLAALLLGLVGLIRLEPRSQVEGPASREGSWLEMSHFILDNHQARRFFLYLTILLAAILGQDILLEPFGGETFAMSVRQTTRITSIWGTCVLVALVVAGVLENRVARRKIVLSGGVLALAGFLVIVASGLMANQAVFYAGVILLGSGTGLSTVSNLSLMLDMTTVEKVGLFIGAWGMSNALSRLLGSLLAGAVRDIFTNLTGNLITGYVAVFVIEAGLVLVSLILLRGIDVNAFRRQAEQPAVLERAALAGEV